MKIEAIIHKAEEGGYWAEVPALPGCVTQGETIKEVKKNIHEAAEGWMRAHEEEGINKLDKNEKRRARIVRVAV